MPSPEQHFILTLGRSGSNTLVNLLNQHPHVLNYGEVLGDWNTIRKVYDRLPGRMRNSEAAYLDAVLQDRRVARALNAYRNLSRVRRGAMGEMKRFGRLRSIGVKEFSLNMERKGLQAFLDDRPHIKVIGLRRDSVLDRFVSWKMMVQTGVIKLEGARDGTEQRLEIDTDTLLRDLRTVDAENRGLTEMLDRLSPDRVHQVDYADLYGTPEQTQEVMREVFGFLNLPAFSPVVRMRKIIKGHPVERIANLEACREAVRGTPFEPVLADPE